MLKCCCGLEGKRKAGQKEGRKRGKERRKGIEGREVERKAGPHDGRKGGRTYFMKEGRKIRRTEGLREFGGRRHLQSCSPVLYTPSSYMSSYMHPFLYGSLSFTHPSPLHIPSQSFSQKEVRKKEAHKVLKRRLREEEKMEGGQKEGLEMRERH
jgi:hypothetical protein